MEEKSCGVVFLSDDLSKSKEADSVGKSSSVRVEGMILKFTIVFRNYFAHFEVRYSMRKGDS